jgi:UDP-glucose 4-epimerase
MLRGEQPTINGVGDQGRDMLYVGDVAAANVAALVKGDGELYHIGSGVSTSVNDIYARLARIVGYGQPARHGPAMPGEVFNIYVDASKAARDLGWRATVDLDEGLRRTVAFFRNG